MGEDLDWTKGGEEWTAKVEGLREPTAQELLAESYMFFFDGYN